MIFVGVLSCKVQIGTDTPKEELFKLYTTMKLSNDGLPENVFPSYVSIKAYVKTLADLNASGKKKVGAVPSATDCQKDEAKVCFVGMKCKS